MLSPTAVPALAAAAFAALTVILTVLGVLLFRPEPTAEPRHYLTLLPTPPEPIDEIAPEPVPEPEPVDELDPAWDWRAYAATEELVAA